MHSLVCSIMSVYRTDEVIFKGEHIWPYDNASGDFSWFDKVQCLNGSAYMDAATVISPLVADLYLDSIMQFTQANVCLL